jgi:hypothetical protein
MQVQMFVSSGLLVFLKPFSWAFSVRWNLVLEQGRFLHVCSWRVWSVSVKGFVNIDSIVYIEKRLLTTDSFNSFSEVRLNA